MLAKEMPLSSGVYGLCAPDGSIVYVGSSRNMRRRCANHHRAKGTQHPCVVLEEHPIAGLYARESYWIRRLGPRMNVQRTTPKRDRRPNDSKLISWYADPKDRHTVDEIKMAEESRDGRPCGATHVITMAVRAFAQLYKANPNHALEMARSVANGADAK